MNATTARLRAGVEPMPYFAHEEAARRYDRFRPYLHGVVLAWLQKHVPHRLPYARALDVGCGTGHSMLALERAALEVRGIDISGPMVSLARAKGLDASIGSYLDLPPRAFDLLSCSMAFHWFDPQAALDSFGRASRDGAHWLVYNFALQGARDEALDAWLNGDYLARFPAPARGAGVFRVPEGHPGLTAIASDSGALVARMTRAQLIGYLTTQTNVEAAVKAGKDYRAVEQLLAHGMPHTGPRCELRFGYSYSLTEFRRRAGAP